MAYSAFSAFLRVAPVLKGNGEHRHSLLFCQQIYSSFQLLLLLRALVASMGKYSESSFEQLPSIRVDLMEIQLFEGNFFQPSKPMSCLDLLRGFCIDCLRCENFPSLITTHHLHCNAPLLSWLRLFKLFNWRSTLGMSDASLP